MTRKIITIRKRGSTALERAKAKIAHTQAALDQCRLDLSQAQRKIDELARDLSEAKENNRGLYRERDKWRANAMSAFAALEDTRKILASPESGNAVRRTR